MANLPTVRDVRTFHDSGELFYILSVAVENTLSFETPENGTVFYSGCNKSFAQNFASSTQKWTIHDTEGGKYLDSLDLFNSNITYARAPLFRHHSMEIWERASAKYAKQARGQIYTFCKGIPPIDQSGNQRMWYKIELPIIIYRDQVTEINFMNNDGTKNGIYKKMANFEQLFENLDIWIFPIYLFFPFKYIQII